MRPITRFTRPYLSAIDETFRWLVYRVRDPQAYSFYTRLMAGGFEPNRHIDVLPNHRLIYVCVPKCASSRIKMTLSKVQGRSPRSAWEANKRGLSGLKGPKHVGIKVFQRVATDPTTLRFSFVRNPYDRLVSCWTNKFRDVPLVSTNPTIRSYLMWRQENDRSLPEGIDRTLRFSDFVNFATATALTRVDAHWQLQDDLLSMPGITLDLVGKVENFANDFRRVLDHAGVEEPLLSEAIRPLNASDHEGWSTYYTRELADRVYQAYERDFDRFEYPRMLRD